MAANLKQYSRQSKLIRVYDIGKAESGKRDIWLAMIAGPKVDSRKVARVLIICRQHGDEPVSTEASMAFIGNIASAPKPQLLKDLSHCVLYIIPMANPDGADALSRENEKGVDINRDWGYFRASETRVIYQAFKSIQPDFVLDMHTWDRGDPFQSTCLEASRSHDALAAATRALQLRAAEEVSEDSSAVVETTGYEASSDDDLCHRYLTERKHVASMLFETSPISDGVGGYGQRVKLAVNMINWTLFDCANHPAAWKRLNQLAMADRPKHPASKSEVMGWVGVYQTPGALFVDTESSFTKLKPLFWALAIYILLMLWVLKMKPKEMSLGMMKIQRIRQPDGKYVTRTAYIESDDSDGLSGRRHGRSRLTK
jgi:hypothetical protein